MTLFLFIQIISIIIVRLTPYLICFSTFHHEPCFVGKIIDFFNFLNLSPENYYMSLYWLFFLFLFYKNDTYYSKIFTITSRIFYNGKYRRVVNKLLFFIKVCYTLKIFLWKPLFKRTSYFGFFNSSRVPTKNTFWKKEKKKQP